MRDIDSLISSMSLKEKLGQLLIVGFAGTELSKEVSGFISDGRFSGFILFKKNMQSVDGMRQLLRGLKSLYPAQRPPILAVDEEGGRVTQIGHLIPAAPPAAKIGSTQNARFAFFQARDVGQKLKWLGFNVVFAPVLDINDEPENPVIGDRSYGSIPEIVKLLGISAVKGFSDAGIIPTAKHFPGHGSSKVDSHEKLPIISHLAERWYTFELLPFRAAIDAGVRMIMVGHIACPALTERDDLPASFSARILREILREELHYKGVVVTDALEMGAAAGYMAVDSGPEEAIEAGCDLLLYAHGGKPALQARESLLKAVKEGRLSEAAVQQSLRRVLALRMSLVR